MIQSHRCPKKLRRNHVHFCRYHHLRCCGSRGDVGDLRSSSSFFSSSSSSSSFNHFCLINHLPMPYVWCCHFLVICGVKSLYIHSHLIIINFCLHLGFCSLNDKMFSHKITWNLQSILYSLGVVRASCSLAGVWVAALTNFCKIVELHGNSKSHSHSLDSLS